MIELQITQASERGSRAYQEDRLVVAYPAGGGTLLAAIDGHGGSQCAELVRNKLAAIYDQMTGNLPDTFFAPNMLTKHLHDGAAISVVYLNHDYTEAIVAILGDAPVVIKDASGQINVSPEHNVRSNMKEREAVTKNGGFYSNGYAFAGNGYNGLQMSRALGDAALASILNREPEIYTVPLGPESFVLLGTDGLFDPSHNDAIDYQPVVEMIESGKTAADLVARAIGIPTQDNASAILVTRKK